MLESLNDSQSALENYYNFMKDEILIRVESLKIEIDDMYTKFCRKIEDKKLETQTNVENSKNEIEKSLNSSKEFLKSLETSPKHDSVKQMYLCDEIVINLEKLEVDLKKCIQNFKFKPNDESINDSFIGYITSINDVIHEGVIQQENGFLFC